MPPSSISTPTFDVDGTSFLATFTEGGAPIPIADIDTLIDRYRSTTIASATITLTDPQAGDLLAASGALPGGIMASSYDPVTGILTLSGVASFADYETALEAIRFSAAGDNPVAGNRIIQVVVNDGTNDSQPATSLVTVVAVNDPPINTVPGGQTVAEDTTLSIASVSVADSDSSALTTTLSVSSGKLDVTAGAGVTGNGTANVTITGTAAEINTALAGLAYTGNPDFNGTDALTVATSDATATATDTIAITVNPVNDAPINTVPGAQSVDEDTILPIAGVLVADIDSSALTTTLSVANGILNVTASPGAVVTGNGTDSVIIAGTAAQINAALAGLAYTGNPNFNGPDILTVATSDLTVTDTDTIAITVNPVNDTPVLNLDADSSTIGGVDYLTTFVDGGPAVAIVDTDVLITDSDDTELTSATVTLTNPQALDSLTFNGPAPGSIIVSGLGTSVITLTGAASAADYQTALLQITFERRHQSFDRDPHHRRGRQRWDGRKQPGARDHRGHPSQQHRPRRQSRRRRFDSRRNELPRHVHRRRGADSDRRRRYADHRYRQHDSRFGDHHADGPAGWRPADRHPAVAGRYHRFRLRPGHRNPDALQRRLARRLRDGAGSDPLQRSRRESGRRQPHRRSRGQRRSKQQPGRDRASDRRGRQ